MNSVSTAERATGDSSLTREDYLLGILNEQCYDQELHKTTLHYSKQITSPKLFNAQEYCDSSFRFCYRGSISEAIVG